LSRWILQPLCDTSVTRKMYRHVGRSANAVML